MEREIGLLLVAGGLQYITPNRGHRRDPNGCQTFLQKMVVKIP